MTPAARPPRIIVTCGEPAGIGPDLCVALAARQWPCQLVIAADASLIAQRARQLGTTLRIESYDPAVPPSAHTPGVCTVLHRSLSARAQDGHLDIANARYVLGLLDAAIDGCMRGEFDAMVTAPVQKSVIIEAGIPFSGHTEYLAERTGAVLPVMLLTAGTLRVALATTHLPLVKVSTAITRERLTQVLRVLEHDLRTRFRLAAPRIVVCGLNPHAGESGHLGREETEVIAPVIESLRSAGLQLTGPAPADTAFTPHMLEHADAVLAMFHDQGLPVIKYAGFGNAVNVTLGLPIIRTSVDHGTALSLAGTGQADAGSMVAALKLALELSIA